MEPIKERTTIRIWDETKRVLRKMKKEGRPINFTKTFNEAFLKQFNSPAVALYKEYRKKFKELEWIIEQYRDMKEAYEKDGKNILDEIKEPKMPYFEDMENLKKSIEKDKKLKTFLDGGK